MFPDHLAIKNDPFSHCDARGRLIAAVLLIASLLPATSVPLLLTGIMVPLALLGRDWRVTLWRLLPVNLMTVALWLPVLAGFNPRAALLYTLRLNCAALFFMAFISPLSISSLASALTVMRVPPKLVTLLVLTWRYIFLLDAGLGTALTSLRLRLNGANQFYMWRSLAAVFAATLVRSVLRAESVAAAMRCRGFDGAFPVTMPPRWHTRDSALILIAFFLSIMMILIQRWLCN